MEGEQHSQQPMEGNPNAYRSMRDYRNPHRMSGPSYIVPPTNVPYSNTYDPSWSSHQNFSWAPRPPQYAPHAHSQYASPSQPQPPQSTSLVEQAILNITKLVGDLVGEQKMINAHWNQRIDNVESSLSQKLDDLQNDMFQKLNNLEDSNSRLANQ